jgi:hypothetical protein
MRSLSAATLLSMLVVCAGWLSPALAQSIQLRADFDGDGFDDLAIGVPGEKAGSGAVNIVYGSASGLTAVGSQFFSQATTGIPDALEAGDNCGAALAAGDFNGDGFADLAMGCPGEDLGSSTDFGAVNIIYGSPSGLTATGSQFFGFTDISSSDISFADKCGSALVAGDFNRDGFADLAMGCPGREVGVTAEGGGVFDAGRVIVLYGSRSGLTTTGRQSFTQATSGVPDTAEANDNCGAALAAGDFNRDGFADLAMGCPGEDLGSSADFGGVNILYGSAAGLTATGSQFFGFTDISAGDLSFADKCGSALAAGDFNRDGADDLAMGCPGREIGVTVEGGGVLNAGRVIVLYGSGAGLTATGRQSFTQATSGVPDTPEANDSCGAGLAAGDFNRDGFADLAMGCPGEDDGGSIDFGGVNILYGSAAGLTATGSQFFGFSTMSAGEITSTDKCGTALAVGHFNQDGFHDLAVGCPGHDIGVTIEGGGIIDAGGVVVLYGSNSGVTATGRQSFNQATPGIVGDPQTGDLFGFALASMGGPAGPGLTGTWQEMVQTCKEGKRLRCRLQGTFEVINPGTQAAPHTALRFFLSADPILDPSDALLSEVGVGELKPGETKRRHLNVHLPEGISASGQFVIASTDADNVVAETDEENNIVPFGPIE